MPLPHRRVFLQEWRDTFLTGVVLSDRDRRLAEKMDKVEIREMREGVYLKASSWVGVIQFEAFTLQIAPKLSNIDLVRMLLVAGGLDRLKRYRMTRDYLLEGELTLFDLLALLLADACSLVARDGLLRDYVVDEADLPVMRGRLRVVEQIRRRYGQVNRLECRYDDHHADVVDNQILYTALELCRHYVQHPLVRGRIQYLAETFAAACGVLRDDWREVRAGLIYQRLNARYEEAHTLAWIVMEGLGVQDLLAAGNTRGVAFLLDMNSLFEAFITVLVRSALKNTPITIRAQATSRSHIWDVGRHQTYQNLRPDLLLETAGGGQLAIDAKYKRYDVRKLDEGDIYQIFLYAYAFRSTEGGIPAALLLYPAEGVTSRPTRLHIRDGREYPQARLHALGVDVPHALNSLMGLGDVAALEQVRDAIQDLLN